MKNILTETEIKNFKKDGAVFLKGKFDIDWINKLKIGIENIAINCDIADVDNNNIIFLLKFDIIYLYKIAKFFTTRKSIQIYSGSIVDHS